MFCPRCGTQNDNTDGVCTSCGFPLPQIPATGLQPGGLGYGRPVYGVPPYGGSDDSLAYRSYAGFWKRLGAFVIDYLVLNAASVVIGYGAGVFPWAVGDISGEYSSRRAIWSTSSLVVYWLYFALMESSPQQATLGKMALSIVVTDVEGKRISFGRATGRYFGKFVSSFILLIGFIMAGFTQKKQALHDLMAGTLVSNKR